MTTATSNDEDRDYATWKSEPSLCDRADGVRGHFCIGRQFYYQGNPRMFTWEFWDEQRQGWFSAGQVFVSVEVAMRAMRNIKPAAAVTVKAEEAK